MSFIGILAVIVQIAMPPAEAISFAPITRFFRGQRCASLLETSTKTFALSAEYQHQTHNRPEDAGSDLLTAPVKNAPPPTMGFLKYLRQEARARQSEIRLSLIQAALESQILTFGRDGDTEMSPWAKLIRAQLLSHQYLYLLRRAQAGPRLNSEPSGRDGGLSPRQILAFSDAVRGSMVGADLGDVWLDTAKSVFQAVDDRSLKPLVRPQQSLFEIWESHPEPHHLRELSDLADLLGWDLDNVDRATALRREADGWGDLLVQFQVFNMDAFQPIEEILDRYFGHRSEEAFFPLVHRGLPLILKMYATRARDAYLTEIAPSLTAATGLAPEVYRELVKKAADRELKEYVRQLREVTEGFAGAFARRP